MIKKIILFISILFVGILQTTFASTNVSGTVSGNWTLANSPYIVTGNITVSNATTLTIDPGVVVKFQANTYLKIEGNLQAVGNSGSKITFTSYNDNSVGGNTGTGTPARGDWGMLYFYNTGSDNSLLDYVDVKYGGNAVSYGAQSIYLQYSDASIQNSLITESSSYGVNISGSSYGSFKNNTISNNAKAFYASNLDHLINATNTFSGNDTGVIISTFTMTSSTGSLTNNVDYTIGSQTLPAGNDVSLVKGNITSNTTWTAANSPYLVVGTVTLNSGVNLTIEPGVVVKFQSSSYYLKIEGNLQAVGNSGNKITFTSINDNTVGGTTGTGTPAKGDWNYIYFNNTGSNSSHLNYVDVKYGGSYSLYGAIRTHYSDVTIENSLITQSASNAIHSNAGAPTIKNNILYKNNTYGIRATGTPNIDYNLYYLNTSGAVTGFTIGTHSIESDPLFVDEVDYALQSGSPAIDAGIGTHPVSGNTNDIGSYESGVDFLTITYTANISDVNGDTLDYTWSFTTDPTSGVTPPVFSSGETGTINADGSISASFVVKKNGSYTIKLSVENAGEVVSTSTSSFTVSN